MSRDPDLGPPIVEWEEHENAGEKIWSPDWNAVEEVEVEELNDVPCPECGDLVYCTEFYGDPDDPVWHFECNDCSIQMSFYPTKVDATARKVDK